MQILICSISFKFWITCQRKSLVNWDPIHLIYFLVTCFSGRCWTHGKKLLLAVSRLFRKLLIEKLAYRLGFCSKKVIEDIVNCGNHYLSWQISSIACKGFWRELVFAYLLECLGDDSMEMSTKSLFFKSKIWIIRMISQYKHTLTISKTSESFKFNQLVSFENWIKFAVLLVKSWLYFFITGCATKTSWHYFFLDILSNF